LGVSFPCLINTLNVPDPVFRFVISHLKLSLEPLDNTPDISGLVLLFTIPSDNVSKVKELEPIFAVPPLNVPTNVPICPV
jgi:hypothetical protein